MTVEQGRQESDLRWVAIRAAARTVGFSLVAGLALASCVLLLFGVLLFAEELTESRTLASAVAVGTFLVVVTLFSYVLVLVDRRSAEVNPPGEDE